MPRSEFPNQPMPERSPTGKWVAAIAVLLALCLIVAIFFPAMLRAKRRLTGPFPQHAMKQMGMAFKMYAENSTAEFWPGLSSSPHVWSPDLSQVYPEYLADPALLVSSEHPGRDGILTAMHYVLEGTNPDYQTAAGLTGLSFAYLGHAVKDEAGFAALVQARNSGLLDGKRENLSVPGHDAMVFPLRDGIERFFITDTNGPAAFDAAISSIIPVMIEIASWKHKRSTNSFRGTYVLYMDGHVRMVPLGTFPVVPEVMDVLSGIAENEPEVGGP